MALLYIEGFEGYASPQDMVSVGATNACRVSSMQSTIPFSSTVFRTTQVTSANSRSLNVNGSKYFGLSCQGSTELIVGFGFYHASGIFNGPIWTVGGGSPWVSSQGIVLAYDGVNTLRVYTNSAGNPGTLLGTASGAYASGVWHYIELRVKLGSSTGEVQLRVNGTDVLNLTNVNTATGSLTSYTGTGVEPSSASAQYHYDDLYVCDTAGSTNNTFLGPISVYALMPTGAGSSTQLDPVGAASNWQAVDEPTADTTTYVETTVTGEKDYYTFESLPAGVSTVFGVLTRTRNTTSDNGGRRLRMNLKNGLSAISSTLRILPFGSWVHEFFLSETAPDGSAWTKSSVDSTEAGVEAQ